MSTPIKTVAIYGDSISTRDYDGGYEPLLKESLSLDTVYNHSIGGSGLSLTTPDNLVSLLNASGTPPSERRSHHPLARHKRLVLGRTARHARQR